MASIAVPAGQIRIYPHTGIECLDVTLTGKQLITLAHFIGSKNNEKGTVSELAVAILSQENDQTFFTVLPHRSSKGRMPLRASYEISVAGVIVPSSHIISPNVLVQEDAYKSTYVHRVPISLSRKWLLMLAHFVGEDRKARQNQAFPEWTVSLSPRKNDELFFTVFPYYNVKDGVPIVDEFFSFRIGKKGIRTSGD